jgi:nuclease A inhibitor-like protein
MVRKADDWTGLSRQSREARRRETLPLRAAKLAAVQPSTKIEEVPQEKFFDLLAQPAEVAPEEEVYEKFKRLLKVAAEQRSGTKVYHIGKVNIDIYIAGKTEDGEWSGLKTKAVENVLAVKQVYAYTVGT